MNFILRQVEPGNPTPIIILLNKDEVIVGRKTITSLLPYPRVSRTHAAFHRIAGIWYVRDIGSHGNLYVNFTKVGKDMRRLDIGDIIGFGASTLHEEEGFICVFVAQSPVKIEVIDLEDDCDTDQPESANESNAMDSVDIKVKHEIDVIELDDTDTTVKEEPVDVTEVVTTTVIQSTLFTPKIEMSDTVVNSTTCSSNNIQVKEENFPQFPNFGPIDAVENNESTLSEESFKNSLINESTQDKLVNQPLQFQTTDFNSVIDTAVKSVQAMQSISEESFISVDTNEIQCDSQLSKSTKNYPNNFSNLSDVNPPDFQPFQQCFDETSQYQGYPTVEMNCSENETFKIPASNENYLKSDITNNAFPIVESFTSLSEEEWLTHSTKTTLHIPEVLNNNCIYSGVYEKISKCDAMNQPVETKISLVTDNTEHMSKCEHILANTDLSKCYNGISVKAEPVLNQSSAINMFDQTASNNCLKDKEDSSITVVDIRSSTTESSSETEYVMKDCSIPLKRCDDRVTVDEINEPKQTEFSLENNSSDNRLRLKINKNRLESDSSESEDDFPPKKKCKRTFIKSTDSEGSYSESILVSESSTEIFDHDASLKISDLWNNDSLLRYGDRIREVVKSPSYNSGSPRLSDDEDENSDSSLSEKSTIIYPSAHVLESKKDKVTDKPNLKCVKVRNNSASLSDDNPSKKENVTTKQKDLPSTQPSKTGKTLLTEPKPFIKRNRGRPRNVQDGKDLEQKDKSKQEKSTSKSHKKSTRSQSVKHADKQKNKTEVAPNEDPDLQNRDIEAVMLSKFLKSFKIPKCSKKEEKKDVEEKKEAKQNISSKENKVSTVIRRPENYGSRMLFLTDINSFKTNPSNKRYTDKNSSSDRNKKFKKAGMRMEKEPTFILDQILGKNLPLEKKSERAATDTKTQGESLKKLMADIHNRAYTNPQRKITNKWKEQGLTTSTPSMKTINSYCKDKCLRKESFTKTGLLPSRTRSENSKSLTETLNTNDLHSKNIAVVSPLQIEAFKANDSPNVSSEDLSLIKMLVKWNPKWLEEQKEHSKPPPILSKANEDALNSFKDYKEYRNYINSLIALRLWDFIYVKSKELFQSDRLDWNNFYCKVLSVVEHQGMTEIKCEAAVSEKVPYCPFEGNVILFNTQDNENNIENCIFGYIIEHKFGVLSELSQSSEWRKIPENWMDRAKPHFFTAYIKRRRKAFNMNSLILAHGICNIKHKLNLVENLSNFQSTPLSSVVMQPNDHQSSFDYSSIKKRKEHFIKTMAAKITENSQPKVFVVEGSPGTGKTYFILELLEKLLFHSNVKLRLFVCTSSNSAADEIGFRLLDVIERYSWQSKTVKFVRIGDCNQMHPKLQSYHYEKMAEHNCKSRKRKETNVRESLERLESKIQSLVLENTKNILAAERESKLKELMNQYESIKTQSSQALELNSKKNWTFKVLDEADVIISTLNSFQDYVDNVSSYQTNVSDKACCIVDEAGECSEPELLQCLIKEVNNLVLVGDAKRSSLVTNRRCSKLTGRQRSMFERLFAVYKNKSESPSLSLISQYRMHSEILQFPSRYFYKNKLNISSEIDERGKSFPLNPYLVLDITDDQQVDQGTDGYLNIAAVFNQVCTFISSSAPIASIGAIAEDQLVALYKNFLSGNELSKRIEVNSVEGFKGREKDVMIVTAVKTSTSFGSEDFVTDEEKFNATLTRARQCLVLYGHISSLKKIKHWKTLIDDAKMRNFYKNVQSITKIPSVLNEFMSKLRR